MRINEKKEIINRLESLLTDYEWEPIKKKLVFYLMNYTTGIQQIVNIKFSIDYGQVSEICLYYEPNKFRKLVFDHGKICNVMHYTVTEDGTERSNYGLTEQSVFSINRCAKK